MHTFGSGTLHIRYSYGQMAELLAPYSRFYSCYRGCLVNLDQVKTVSKTDFILYNGDRVPIRQKDVSTVANTYADYLFEKQRGMQP